ncbi:helix-turn-helix domain-containing protein [Kordia sp.]|uniref:helix-turn-helix domain-containing protein n=1 Tax=Kordia sp. TaxID=1965332 RepID=UPI003D271E38
MLRLLKKLMYFFQNILKKEHEEFKKNTLDINEVIVLNVMDKLSNFEKNQEFLKQVSLHTLARKSQTNPKYLSKIINIHYEKNFSSYINDLRIKYLLKELQKNDELKTYTVKALAKKLGFTSTEVFSKAFKKHTGINPSTYLHSLNHR